MTYARVGNAVSKEHQVLTLETGKLSWRMIECGVPHFPHSNSVCINGVLYYKAKLNGSCLTGDMMIMSFNVRSEKYSLIKVMEPFIDAVRHATTLVNYNGKLASIRESVFLHCVGVTDSNEVVLANHSLDGPFYVFYYCLESETIRRVEIQGLGAFRGFRVYTFVDHV
uniref:F-box associated beta-propeller type 3 domain-containing protein n=2 Tax=Brassica oleracea TaxID=3712 RepID=A0A0D3EHK1_BRAOL|nr:unnamed protein product [Brassica oleracea]